MDLEVARIVLKRRRKVKVVFEGSYERCCKWARASES
jgi:hypothetical protein